jgi:D-lactate dehydrogenase
MKIYFFDIEAPEEELLRSKLKGHELHCFPEQLNMETVSQAQDAEAIGIFIYSHIDRELLAQMPQLKFITTSSTGYDHIDLDACKEKNILVSNVPTYGENTVAEHTFGLLLNLTRKIHKAYLQTIQGDFSLDELRGVDLKGKTLGIVGLGHIGEHVARIARGFEMEILVHDPILEKNISLQSGQFVSFEELLESSDVISFHCPLSETTKHMFNKESLKKCKNGVFIINTARGPVVETEALLMGLEKGIIAGAGLDVLEEEQCIIREEKEILSKNFDSDCMRITLENHVLLHHPKVIITPHNAFNSEEALQRIYDVAAENLLAYESGDPINIVSP